MALKYCLLFLLAYILFADSLIIWVGNQNYSFDVPLCPKFKSDFATFDVDLVVQDLMNETANGTIPAAYTNKIVVFKDIPHLIGYDKWFLGKPALGFIFTEKDIYQKPGSTCLLHIQDSTYRKDIIVGVMLNKSYNAIKNFTKLNGTIDSFGNKVLRARIFNNEKNDWFTTKEITWLYCVAFIIIFLGCIILASYKFYFVLKKKVELSVAFICLLFILIANIIRIIYFILGPLWYYDVIMESLNIPFITATWPFSLFNILLISLFWEELLSKSFTKKSFIDQYRNVWIGICIVIFVLTLIPTIVMVLVESGPLFDLAVLITLLSQLFFGFCNIIYCIINTVRFATVISRNLNAKKKKHHFILRRTSICIIVANFGLFIFLISLIMVIGNLNYGYHTRLIPWTTMYIGQMVCELGILFSFKTAKAKKTSTATASKTGTSTKSQGK